MKIHTDVHTPANCATWLGGKAAGLVRLREAGCRVPTWFGIAADASEDMTEEIVRAYENTFSSATYVAVRSSALAEDGAVHSFAGLHDSFVFVRGRDALLAAVRNVWASVYNERALAYRRQNGLPVEDIGIAIVVQAMVDAEISGVAFTAHPTTGNVHEIVISSLFGAGEGLVSAGLDADTYVVTKATLAVDSTIVGKPVQLVLDEAAGGGLKEVAVADAQQKLSSLSDGQIAAVARAGLKLEKAFGRPLDIEFSFDAEGELWILQARPVTTVAEYGPAAGNRCIWDNSNIIESYAGVTTPMTFSFVRRAYTIVYRCFADVMGIPPRIVRENEPTFENMLGLFRGRIYYNLMNWYRLVSLFPGFNFNRKFMESMMGVKESLDTGEAAPRKNFRQLPALVKLGVRSSWKFLRISKLVRRFDDNFDRHYKLWAAMDFDAMPPHELMRVYGEMEDALLWRWQAPIVNDFFVMIFYGTLKKLCVSWCSDETGSLQNGLLSGEGGIESTQPTRMLIQLAHMARKNPNLREEILTHSPEDLAAALPHDPRFPDFAEALADYLDRYGFRCVDELKLEEYSLRDRPAFIYQVLRNYLRQDTPDVEAMEAREKAVRAEAETRAMQAIRTSILPRRTLFRWVLRNARMGVRNRENMRFARTKIFGLVRELLRAVGTHLANEGVLDNREDVFYLTLDEVWDFVKGTAVTARLKDLATLRRAEFDAYRNDTDAPDDRFETYGMAYHRNLFQSGKPEPQPAADGVLRGTACCPGQVTGPVKALRTPTDGAELSGEILAAERTDPGWVPLYPSVSGLLIERGSILSHSAIVAREMGIPTIVGIPGLLATIADGQRVRMDGAAGTVEVL